MLGVSQPTVSQHIQLLRDAGLLYQERSGNKVFYHTDRDAVKALLEMTSHLLIR